MQLQNYEFYILDDILDNQLYYTFIRTCLDLAVAEFGPEFLMSANCPGFFCGRHSAPMLISILQFHCSYVKYRVCPYSIPEYSFLTLAHCTGSFTDDDATKIEAK